MEAYHFLARSIRWDDDVLVMDFADGTPMFRNRTIKAEPMTRIVSTFEPQWPDSGPPTRSVMTIAQEGGHCRLTLEHFDLTTDAAKEAVRDGWARWAAGLKTWLETGQAYRFNDA